MARRQLQLTKVGAKLVHKSIQRMAYVTKYLADYNPNEFSPEDFGPEESFEPALEYIDPVAEIQGILERLLALPQEEALMSLESLILQFETAYDVLSEEVPDASGAEPLPWQDLIDTDEKKIRDNRF